MLSINYRDARPLYEQVRDELRKLVLTGAIAPDEKLPSVRELASQLAINPNTIQRAYRELEQLGVVYTMAGKGVFAAPLDDARTARAAELLEVLDSTVSELSELGVALETINQQVRAIYAKEDK